MTSYDESRRDGTDTELIDERVVGPDPVPEGEVTYENVDRVLADVEETGSVAASLEEREYGTDAPADQEEPYDELDEGNPFTDDPVTGSRNDLLL